MKKLYKEDIFVIIFSICAVIVAVGCFFWIKDILKEGDTSAAQVSTSPFKNEESFVTDSDNADAIKVEAEEIMPDSEEESYTEEETYTEEVTYYEDDTHAEEESYSGKLVNVYSDSSAIREGAGETFRQIATASMGSTYAYLGEEKNGNTIWYKVLLDDGRTGYIANTVSKKLSDMPKSGDETIDSIACKYGIMGMQVAVIDSGQVTDTYEYGYAVKDNRKMTDSTAIRIASPSKVALAMNAMGMLDEGIIDFDTDIGDYWGFAVRNPMYKDEIITLRSIFSHVSSFAECSYQEDSASQLKGEGCFGNLCPNDASSWNYCNFAIGVAGSTIEMAYGESILDYSQRFLFEPLGITASFASGQMDSHELAELYRANHSVARTIEKQKSMKYSSKLGGNTACYAGGLTISAKDYAKLICVLVNDGEYEGKRYLSAQSVALMEEKQFTTEEISGIRFSQCLPLRCRSDIYGRSELYYHTGNAYGVLALVSYDPRTRDGVVVITTGANETRDKYGIYAVCGEITQYIYSKY